MARNYYHHQTKFGQLWINYNSSNLLFVLNWSFNLMTSINKLRADLTKIKIPPFGLWVRWMIYASDHSPNLCSGYSFGVRFGSNQILPSPIPLEQVFQNNNKFKTLNLYLKRALFLYFKNLCGWLMKLLLIFFFFVVVFYFIFLLFY